MEMYAGSNNYVDFDHIHQKIEKGIYRWIGAGSGRTVYDLGNGYVVKIAKNRKGRAQNEVEYKISMVDNSGLFANIRYASNGFDYIVMDKAPRVHSISEVWSYYHVRNNKGLLDILSDLSDIYGLVLPDFGRAANWGVIKGRPVIIDYGFTRDVRRRYYRRGKIFIHAVSNDPLTNTMDTSEWMTEEREA